MNEQTLIQQLQQGNEAAFRWLVEHYRNPVYNTVLNILQDETEADDSAQEVFIKVFQSIGQFKESSLLSTWIYRIAVNLALDKLRRQKTRKKLQRFFHLFPEDKEPESASCYHPGVKLENKENAAVLFEAIRSLPENQRIAFTLLKVQGLSYEEVTGIMQKNIKAIESLMSRAKQNLQKKLEQHDKY